MKYIFVCLCMLFAMASCGRKTSPVEDPASFEQEYREWQEKRIERLKSEKGWLNLAGLYWLQEGKNTFGSDSSNTIVFPDKFPKFGGEILVEDSSIQLSVNDAVNIFSGGKQIEEMTLHHDQEKNTSILEYRNYRWFIIKRGERFGIRLRNLEHPRIRELDHIPSYPLSEKWVVEAEFVPFDSARTIEVPTVIEGFSEYYKAEGKLQFRIKGKKYSLLPFTSGKGYFLIVGDATNGIETYGAGRFMYTDQVEENKVILDFNRAYNPPCAFSPFATCPLPPPENILDLEIKAGERGIHLD